jgi:LEA14-like dessication related protein
MRFVMLLCTVVLSLFVLACSKPKPPTLTPKAMMVTAITAESLEFQVEIDVFNPNDFALSATSVEGQITVADKYDLGTVASNGKMAIPAKGKETLRVPMKAKWPDVAALALLAAEGKGIPYAFTGAVKVTKIDVELPVTLTGVLPQRQLVDAASRSLRPLDPSVPRAGAPR